MGVLNQLPPLMVETSFLWTASDPTLAMIDGDDMLPDVAIGRLPAKNVDELRVMVAKILTFENGDASFQTNPLVLVADNPDRAGDFVANADEIAASVLPSERVEKVYLSELGTTATRAAIVRFFDDGASLVSYIGHGGHPHVGQREHLQYRRRRNAGEPIPTTLLRHHELLERVLPLSILRLTRRKAGEGRGPGSHRRVLAHGPELEHTRPSVPQGVVSGSRQSAAPAFGRRRCSQRSSPTPSQELSQSFSPSITSSGIRPSA